MWIFIKQPRDCSVLEPMSYITHFEEQCQPLLIVHSSVGTYKAFGSGLPVKEL